MLHRLTAVWDDERRTQMSSTQAAKADVSHPEPAGIGGVADAVAPAFRRAMPRDAVNAAQATFLASERVDMGTLAGQLAISRATLYRWFGSRDQLVERILVQLADGFCSTALIDLEPEGDDRVLEYARRLMAITVGFEPLRAFVEREPQLALRLLIGQRGAIHAVISRALLAVVSETRTAGETAALEPNVDVVVWVATSLQWATLAGGEEPQTERVVEIVRALLTASPVS
jgi:AcrR family transcriptional regulator